MRRAGLVLALLVLVGCAAPAVSITQGQAALLYADAREFYGRVAGPLTMACRGSQVPPATCADLRALQGRLADLDPQIRAALTDAKSPVDYAALEKIFGVVLKIGGLLGPLVGLP
jgi:hypothetical protein